MTEEKPKKPEWVKIKPAELEKLVIELHKEGNPPAKIGLILRDKHGVPRAKLIGKKISRIIREAKLPIKSERETIEKQMASLSAHIEKNKHDQPAKKKLVKYLWATKRAA